MNYGIHWFRRDLRLDGNSALLANSERHAGRVLGVFFFDSRFLARPDFSHARFAFFLKTLVALREELRVRGGDLLVLDARPARGFSKLIGHLAKGKAGKPALVSFNRDYEPFARARDTEVTDVLERSLGVAAHSERDHLLIEPGELKRDGVKAFYQVYSPFARRWFELLRGEEVLRRLEKTRAPRFSLTWKSLVDAKSGFPDQLESFIANNNHHVTVEIPEAGAGAARNLLKAFGSKLEDYQEQRDLPAVAGTSQLSIYLKNGSLTTAQVIASLDLSQQRFKAPSGPTQYLKELVWREFYYHILWHRPDVEQDAFLEKFRSIEWENREDLFDAWKEGRTGYPIVDAGMRQLNQTGWMHNRVRMIVASFLTKDLLIDYRWGEKYFMEKLLDGDLAPNNGGWQWAASTGCDPQPYFRIFNPTLQSRKFDPDGVYLKRWLPERQGLKGKKLHEPIDPVVVHESRRFKALKLYKQ